MVVKNGSKNLINAHRLILNDATSRVSTTGTGIRSRVHTCNLDESASGSHATSDDATTQPQHGPSEV